MSINTSSGMNNVIVVVGPHCWGKGDSLRQALGRARMNWRANRSGQMPYNAYEASDDVEVDDCGGISAQSLVRVREVRYDDKGKQIVRVGKQVIGD